MKRTPLLLASALSLVLATPLAAQSAAWQDVGTTVVHTTYYTGLGTSAVNDRLTIQGGGISFNHPTQPYPYVGMDYDSVSDTLRLRANYGATVLNRNWLVMKRETGYVGIGTATPSDRLTLQSGALAFANPANSIPYVGIDYDSVNDQFRVRANYNGSVLNRTAVSIDRETNNMTIHANPNNPTGTRLTVNGDIVASGSVTATYQDIAEWVPATAAMAAGTVVRLSRSAKNMVEPSGAAYETSVAGVVSAQPGIILGVAGEGKAQIATTGRVTVRATAAGGAIEIGDLLVTSGTAGTAMKSRPLSVGGAEFHRPGTIIGKALEPLAEGDGEILVLLSLQ